MYVGAETNGKQVIETDLLVIGGGFAGVSAACAGSDAGVNVLLIEPRTYLGEEITATQRMWVSPTEMQAQSGSLRLFESLISTKGFSHETNVSEYSLCPDNVKLLLEEELLKRNIRLLYQVRPIRWNSSEEFGYTVHCVGKAGELVIKAARVIDATVQGVLARSTVNAEQRYRDGHVSARRVLEFIRVDLQQLGNPSESLLSLPMSISMPKEFGGIAEVHQGHQGEGHLLLSFSIDWLVDTSAAGRNSLEVLARLESRNLAKWLIGNHPAFSAARWVSSSHECEVPSLFRISGTQTADLVEAKHRTVEGVWVVSGLADVNNEDSLHLVADVGQSVQLGTVVGRLAATRDGVLQSCSGISVTREVRHVDTLVIGGGTSGVPAAVSAAECGCRTLLVDMNPALGGAGTLGGVDSYWYGRRAGFNQRVSAAVATEHRWMGIPETQAKWNLEAKMYAWLHLATSAKVDVILHSVLAAVMVDDHAKVIGAWIATRDGLIEIHSRVVIDATGDGDVAVRAGADYVYGSDRDSVTMWYSMIPFPKPGQSRNNWTSTVDVDSAVDMTRAVVSARRRWVGHDHSVYIAPRETRHILGSVRLTLTDQLRFRRWPDVVNIAYSNHDIKGQSTSDWLRLGLIPPNVEVEIPVRALIPNRTDGVLIAGKAISATHDALPAIRMQADLENLGSVCGIMAGLCRELQIYPREIPVQLLQTRLVQHGLLPEDILHRTIIEESLTKDQMQYWVMQLNDGENLYDFSDMGFGEIRRDPIPIVMVCTAGPEILPFLREEATNPDSARRLMAARALAWYGDKAAVPVLLAEIMKHLQQDELPYRDSKIRNTQASPDQGAMPDLCYLLHTIAMVRDERAIEVLNLAVPKLQPTMEKFMDHRSGIFHYVDSLCDIAEQLGDSRCIPALLELHQKDLFKNRVYQGMAEPNYFEERTAYLEILIGRALARCGSKEGLQVLIDYLNDSRRTLVRHAYQELKDISGLDYPMNARAWQGWLDKLQTYPVKPWIAERGAT